MWWIKNLETLRKIKGGGGAIVTDITCNKAFPMFQYETVRLLGIFLEKYYFQSLYLKRSTYLWNVLANFWVKNVSREILYCFVQCRSTKYIFFFINKKNNKNFIRIGHTIVQGNLIRWKPNDRRNKDGLPASFITRKVSFGLRVLNLFSNLKIQTGKYNCGFFVVFLSFTYPCLETGRSSVWSKHIYKGLWLFFAMICMYKDDYSYHN